MAKFVELVEDGSSRPIWINPDHVAFARASTPGLVELLIAVGANPRTIICRGELAPVMELLRRGTS